MSARIPLGFGRVQMRSSRRGLVPGVPLVRTHRPLPGLPRCEGLSEGTGADVLSADVDKWAVLGPVAPDRPADDPPVGAMPEDSKGVGRSGVIARPEGAGVLLRELSL